MSERITKNIYVENFDEVLHQLYLLAVKYGTTFVGLAVDSPPNSTLIVDVGDDKQGDKLYRYCLIPATPIEMVSHIDRLTTLGCMKRGKAVLPDSIIQAYNDAQRQKELDRILQEQHAFLQTVKNNSERQVEILSEQHEVLTQMKTQSDAMTWHSWAMFGLTVVILALMIVQIIIACKQL